MCPRWVQEKPKVARQEPNVALSSLQYGDFAGISSLL